MTIKPVVRQRKLTSFNGGTAQKSAFPVLLYVYDRGKKYYLSTSFTTNDARFTGRFNDKGVDYALNKARTIALQELLDKMVLWYNENIGLSVDVVKDKLTALVKGVSANGGQKEGKHLADWIEEFGGTHEEGTAGIYHRTSVVVKEFDEKVDIEGVTLDWLNDFVDWMTFVRVKRLAKNTQAIHLRNIKATLRWYGRPSKHQFNNRVFEEYEIKGERVDNFYMDEQQVADFRDYPCEPWQERYRDFCMLSLYLAGVNTNDLLLIKGLTNGRFVKNRGKTTMPIDLPVCDEAREIIERYKGDEYLLEFMDGLSDYETFSQHLNRAIKTIGLVVKVKDKLGKMRKVEYHPMFPRIKMYSFRYSFGTICANIEGVSADMIGVCMAHGWAINGNVTSQRYILNNRKRIDRTMKLFVERLREFKGRPKEVIDEEIRKRDGLA